MANAVTIQSRAEQYYAYLTGAARTYPDVPQSRLEEYLHYLCEHRVQEGLTSSEIADLKRILSEYDPAGYQIQRDDEGFFLNIADPNEPHVQFLALNDDPNGSSLMIDTGTAVYGTNDIAGNSNNNIFEIRR